MCRLTCICIDFSSLARSRNYELCDAQFPHSEPALNHRPLDSELKTILLDALSASRLGAHKNLYQQYCNRSHNGNTGSRAITTVLYNDIQDPVKYDSDGVKSSTRDSDADIEDSDGSRTPGFGCYSGIFGDKKGYILGYKKREGPEIGGSTRASRRGAVTRTAPAGKNRSSKQHLSVKHSNSQSTPRPITVSTTSHPTLVVDR